MREGGGAPLSNEGKSSHCSSFVLASSSASRQSGMISVCHLCHALCVRVMAETKASLEMGRVWCDPVCCFSSVQLPGRQQNKHCLELNPGSTACQPCDLLLCFFICKMELRIGSQGWSGASMGRYPMKGLEGCLTHCKDLLFFCQVVLQQRCARVPLEV